MNNTKITAAIHCVPDFCGWLEKTLIQERRQNCDDGDDDERGDTIKLLELRQIVEKKLQQNDAK